MEILLGLIISASSYLILPFAFFYKRTDKYDNKTIKILLIFNSIIVKLLWILLEVILYGDYQDMNFAPAVLYYFINTIIWSNKTEEKSKNVEENLSNEKKEIAKSKEKKKTKQKNSNKSLLIVLAISIILNIVLIGFTFNLNYKIKEQEETIERKSSDLFDLSVERNSLKISLNNILGGKTELYMQKKLNFFDDNIVFVIDGYGNYYSNYDCMLQRVGNNNYNYWAYNKNAAIGKGYKEYKCN